MKIGIVGGGGIGSYYAATLTRAGIGCTLVTRGSHLAAIESSGLVTHDHDGAWIARPYVTSSFDALRDCDSVILAVKGYSIDEVAPALIQFMRGDAFVVPILNGVDVAERLHAHGLAFERIVGGVVRLSVSRGEPGHVHRHSPFNSLIVGELTGVVSARLISLAEVLARAGIEMSTTDNIQLELWRKFAFFAAVSSACALSRTPVGPLRATAGGMTLFASLVAEGVAVSRSTRGALDEQDAKEVVGYIASVPDHFTPSFLLDFLRGGPTELDLLGGTVCRLARAAAIPTPIHETALAACQAALAAAQAR